MNVGEEMIKTEKIEEGDPVHLWESVRPTVLPSLSLWDILVDKSVTSAKEKHLMNAPKGKLAVMKLMMHEMDIVIDNITKMLQDCCTPVDVDYDQGVEKEEALTLSRLFSFLFFDAKQVVLNEHVPQHFQEYLFSSRTNSDTNPECTLAIKEEAAGLDLSKCYAEHDDFQAVIKKKRRKERKNGEKKTAFAPSTCQHCQAPLNNKQAARRHTHCTRKRKENMWQKCMGRRIYCVHPDCGMPDGIVTEDSKSFPNRSQFWKHLVKEHTSEKDMIHQCKSCTRKFPFETMLIEHTYTTHGRKATCEICGKFFTCEGSLKVHKTAVHTLERPYLCPHCPLRFSNNASLCSHKKIVHSDIYKPKMHICEECGKQFKQAWSLKEHMYTHSDVKRYSCDICGRQLKNDSCYRRHMVCVHGRKFTCEQCGKDFSSKVGMTVHKRKEHGIT